MGVTLITLRGTLRTISCRMWACRAQTDGQFFSRPGHTCGHHFTWPVKYPLPLALGCPPAPQHTHSTHHGTSVVSRSPFHKEAFGSSCQEQLAHDPHHHQQCARKVHPVTSHGSKGSSKPFTPIPPPQTCAAKNWQPSAPCHAAFALRRACARDKQSAFYLV